MMPLSGLVIESNEDLLLVADGARPGDCDGGPFYINIRLGTYDPLVTMTELWQRLTVSKGRIFLKGPFIRCAKCLKFLSGYINGQVLANYLWTYLLQDTLGISSIYIASRR